MLSLGLAGCGDDLSKEAPVEKKTEQKTGKKEMTSVPNYTIEEEHIDGSIWYVTLLTPSTSEEELNALVEHTAELAKKESLIIDSIFVKVKTKDSVAKSYAATGKVALSNRGKAQTGLADTNKFEFEYYVDKRLHVLNNVVNN